MSSWFHSAFFCGATVLVSSVKASFASAWMERSARMFLPCSEGSASMWMIFAFGANLLRFPETRSENRAPTVIKRSHSATALFETGVPCMPIIPRFLGYFADRAERPIRLKEIGALILSANRTSSLDAPEAMIPPPA
ncbi:hypothetical protein SDC9_191171 [bioreactor metagenome]|uniref:Uncharacterized protein n=1 Tax=bioreactor metagenome TaxID=1076179 RepID=A0A645HX49_9ZZZZ